MAWNVATVELYNPARFIVCYNAIDSLDHLMIEKESLIAALHSSSDVIQQDLTVEQVLMLSYTIDSIDAICVEKKCTELMCKNIKSAPPLPVVLTAKLLSTDDHFKAHTFNFNVIFWEGIWFNIHSLLQILHEFNTFDLAKSAYFSELIMFIETTNDRLVSMRNVPESLSLRNWYMTKFGFLKFCKLKHTASVDKNYDIAFNIIIDLSPKLLRIYFDTLTAAASNERETPATQISLRKLLTSVPKTSIQL